MSIGRRTAVKAGGEVRHVARDEREQRGEGHRDVDNSVNGRR